MERSSLQECFHDGWMDVPDDCLEDIGPAVTVIVYPDLFAGEEVSWSDLT